MGLLLLTLTSRGLFLHSWLIQLNEIAFVKLDKIVNPVKNTFWTMFINISSIIIYSKIIYIYTYTFNPVLFILSVDQSFEIFPKHNGGAAISESFALNL